MEEREPLLGAERVGYSAGKVEILKDVEVAVGEGELLGIIGPNGAGKTTLLRILAGLLVPAHGVVRLEGIPLGGIPPRARARRIAFMSQGSAPSFPFTVMEILLMGRYPHLGRFQPETAEDRETALRMLSYVGLSGFEDRPFTAMSGGEQQLALFARVLVQETDALLLDEPSSHLDILHQDRIFSMAAELAREGKGIAVCVHNLDVASQYCSRLALLDRGRIAAQGRPDEVLRPEILDGVYGARTSVTRNTGTGGLHVNIMPVPVHGGGPRIHVIGGAGSAVNLTRELTRRGLHFTAGIAHEYDTDGELWRNLGVECPVVEAFSRISGEDVLRYASLVEQADLTVLCSFPLGVGNLGNLHLAARARRLVIVASGGEELPRSFFDPTARSAFRLLEERGRTLSYGELLKELDLLARG